jgi:hypothetical protein
MIDPNEDEEPKGVVDGVAIFYIVAGIPAMWGFMLLLFGAVKLWNIPA